MLLRTSEIENELFYSAENSFEKTNMLGKEIFDIYLVIQCSDTSAMIRIDWYSNDSKMKSYGKLLVFFLRLVNSAMLDRIECSSQEKNK